MGVLFGMNGLGFEQHLKGENSASCWIIDPEMVSHLGRLFSLDVP